jgi:serine-type D-Ala-D-Ala carboxypeptidase/endopeptidase (penicillin-binding protein 4)
MIERKFLLFGLAILVASCSPKSVILKSLLETEAKFKDHTGFALYDPLRKKALIDYNSEKYFTPASNTKIFTFYTALKLLGDSVVALKYIEKNDSLIFWGMGDPSFLYRYSFQNGKIFDFLKGRNEKLFLATSNFKAEPLGEGWAWDDYLYDYSVERSPFPIYGNLISVKKTATQGVNTVPAYFSQFIVTSEESREKEDFIRAIGSNQLSYHPGKQSKNEWAIPFRVSAEILSDLLSDTLRRKVSVVYLPMVPNAKSVRSTPVDSLYKVMMEDSDNYIAEQLLLQCAAVLSDTLKPEIAIRYATKNLFADLPDKLQWVDGSGLSRFNLFTPRSIVKLWDKIYSEVPRERLFQLLAKGGRSGTIKNWYKADVPYIYAKTGTLSNNHSLSGYLVTKKGKTLIFSMMSNNFVSSTNEVRKQMEKIFKLIYESY